MSNRRLTIMILSLLLLAITTFAWLRSYFQFYGLGYCGMHRAVEVFSIRDGIYVSYFSARIDTPGWKFFHSEVDLSYEAHAENHGFHFLGFSWDQVSFKGMASPAARNYCFGVPWLFFVLLAALLAARERRIMMKMNTQTKGTPFPILPYEKTK